MTCWQCAEVSPCETGYTPCKECLKEDVVMAARVFVEHLGKTPVQNMPREVSFFYDILDQTLERLDK